MRSFYFTAKNIGKDRYLTYIMGEGTELDEDALDYYMEHNELERISSNITILRSNLRNISDNNYAEIRALIDEIKYRLEYIKNKQKLGLKNIF